jgi:hypothetical protein
MYNLSIPVPAPDCSSFTPISYEFLHPYKAILTDKDGNKVLTGYGIGELIHIMEPSVQLLVCAYDYYKELPLEGGYKLEVNDDLHLKKVWVR